MNDLIILFFVFIVIIILINVFLIKFNDLTRKITFKIEDDINKKLAGK